jgi:hypothetical protein
MTKVKLNLLAEVGLFVLQNPTRQNVLHSPNNFESQAISHIFTKSGQAHSIRALLSQDTVMVVW